MVRAGRITEMTRMQLGAVGTLTEKPWTNSEVFMQREGLLHILWMNRAAHNEVPSYHVGFADYQSGDAKMRRIWGNEHLRSFLGLEIGVSSQAIESVFEKLDKESVANIVNVVLPDDKLAGLGLV
jgi:hypothetical protein